MKRLIAISVVTALVIVLAVVAGSRGRPGGDARENTGTAAPAEAETPAAAETPAGTSGSADHSGPADDPIPPRPAPVNTHPREISGSVQPPAAPAPQPLPQAEAAVVARELNDVSIPLSARTARIRELAARGDGVSIRILMDLGDADVYLSAAAVEALGTVRSPGAKATVTDYLRGKLGSTDLKVLSAAIKGLGNLAGDSAIPELERIIRENRVRPDGYEQMVLIAAVETLQHIGIPECTPILVEELGRSEDKGWSLAYGSVLVEALKQIRTPEGKTALLAYADRLAERRPDDPLAGRHYDDKVAEARAAAGAD
ncbi:MAG: HEAT repeat domain-containing protein [Planctomycetes bacterium]|nr:HEAT repeat domain-containing protein [Planctomycetota bacterium]